MINQQAERLRKTKVKGETNSFTCFLIYFFLKALFVLVLIKYDNYLKHETQYILPLIFLLFLNGYLMLTTGKNPGFENQSIEENQLLKFEKNQNNYCEVCKCRMKNRTKHCYYCGKCVRKYDHHCPWIGGCVGQSNHFKFLVLLLTLTIQGFYGLYICYKSIGLFEYKFADGHFSPQYGVFSVFSIFMVLYICFAGGLLGFHAYLICFNLTSREMMNRSKCSYLKDVKGNPFNQGICKNISMAIQIDEGGHQWYFEKPQNGSERKKGFLELLWSNDYYSCC